MRTMKDMQDGMSETLFLTSITNFEFFANHVMNMEILPFHLEWVQLVLNNRRIAIQAPTGFGKCLGKGTKVIMYDGTFKKVEDVYVGDLLMGDDSKPRTVLSLGKGTEEMYKLIPNKGEPFVFNKSHILTLKRTNDGTKLAGKPIDILVFDYLNKSKTFKHVHKGYRVPVNFESERCLPINPYTFGLWLGDGDCARYRVTNSDPVIGEWLAAEAQNISTGINQWVDKRNGVPSYSISYFNPYLKKLNVINNKHIPYDYKINSRNNRLQLLAGLLDTDGYYNKGCYEIITKFDKLNDDILFLARSLGFAAYSTKKIGTIKSLNFTGEYHRIIISGKTHLIPCKVKRKQAKFREQKKDVLSFGFKLENAGIGEYYGFMLDGNGRFLLSDFTVTHNTTILGNAFCLWQSYLSQGKQFCIVSKTLPQSRKILKEIKFEIENNDLLFELIPKNKPLGHWCSADDMELSNGCKIFCRPYSENIKGIHVDYLLGDEVASYDDATIWHSFIVTRTNAKDGTCVAISTPDNIADLMQELIHNPEYIGKSYPARIDSDGKGDLQGKSIWPSRWPEEKLDKIMAEIGIPTFDREYQCNPKAQVDSAIYPPHLITECFDYGSGFTHRAMEGFTVIACDFAIAEGPRADYDAYYVLHKHGKKVTLLYAERHRGFPISAKVNRLKELYGQYRVKLQTDDAGLEMESMTSSTIKFIVDPSNVGQAVYEELRLNGLPVDVASFDSMSRAGMLINLRQLLEGQDLIIPRNSEDAQCMKETDVLIKEMISMNETRSKSGLLTYQSKAAHDDTVMALAMGASSMSKRREFIDCVAI